MKSVIESPDIKMERLTTLSPENSNKAREPLILISIKGYCGKTPALSPLTQQNYREFHATITNGKFNLVEEDDDTVLLFR